MTVFDAINKLLEWFQKNDTFNFGRDFKKVILISDNKERDEQILQIALKKLEQNEIISCGGTPDSKEVYYILNKKLAALEQTVVLDGNLALEVAKKINDFCEKEKIEDCLADPLAIKAKDIMNLLNMIEIFKVASLNKEESE